MCIYLYNKNNVFNNVLSKYNIVKNHKFVSIIGNITVL